MSTLQRKKTLTGYNYFAHVTASELTFIISSVSVYLKVCSGMELQSVSNVKRHTL